MTVAKLSSKLLARKGAALPSSHASSVAHLLGQEYFFQNAEGGVSAEKGVRSINKQRTQTVVKKTLKLDAYLNRNLCLLAARTGVSQQKIMAGAIRQLIEQALADDSCICSYR